MVIMCNRFAALLNDTVVVLLTKEQQIPQDTARPVLTVNFRL